MNWFLTLRLATMPTKTKSVEAGKRIYISANEIVYIKEYTQGSLISLKNGTSVKVFESVDEIEDKLNKTFM